MGGGAVVERVADGIACGQREGRQLLFRHQNSEEGCEFHRLGRESFSVVFIMIWTCSCLAQISATTSIPAPNYR